MQYIIGDITDMDADKTPQGGDMETTRLQRGYR
jgi:hypothetical protein